MKELVEDLKIANDNLYSVNQMLYKEIERLNNIIKEVKEYIEDSLYVNKETGEFVLTHTFDKCNLYELLKILDKGE